MTTTNKKPLTGLRAYSRDLAKHIPSRGERRRLMRRMRSMRAWGRRQRKARPANPDLRSRTTVRIGGLRQIQSTFTPPSVEVGPNGRLQLTGIGHLNGRMVRKARTKRIVAEKMKTHEGREWLRLTGFGDKKERTKYGFFARGFGAAFGQKSNAQKLVEEKERRDREKKDWAFLRKLKRWVGGK